MYCFILLCTNTMDLPTGWQNFFLFPRKTNYMQWTCELPYFMSCDYYQLILFTLVDKLHICVLLICFISSFFCAVSYYLFIHVRKTWTRKYTYTLLELKSGNIRIFFIVKTIIRRSTLTFFTTSGNEKVYILAAGQVFSIKWYQIKQVDINRLQ